MKRPYILSAVIIAVIALVIMRTALHNEDISMLLTGTALTAAAAFVTALLTAPVSRRIISTGERIENKPLRVLYYIVILPLILLAVYLLCLLITLVYDSIPQSEVFSEALSAALITVFLYVIAFVLFVVPYVQALIVLLLRRIFKDTEK